MTLHYVAYKFKPQTQCNVTEVLRINWALHLAKIINIHASLLQSKMAFFTDISLGVRKSCTPDNKSASLLELKFEMKSYFLINFATRFVRSYFHLAYTKPNTTVCPMFFLFFLFCFCVQSLFY